MKKPDTQTVILLVLFLLAAGNVVAAFGVYERASLIKDLRPGKGNEAQPLDSNRIAKDMKTLLDPPVVRKTSYAVIADKNLFSSKRAAWRPEAPEPEAPEEVFSEARRTDVVLAGIFKIGGRTGAMLEFPNLKIGSGTSILFPGESVSADSGKKGKSYTLVKIAASSATIKDQSGIVFNVPLYDASKKNRSKGAAPVAKTSISVETDEAKDTPTSVVAGPSYSAEAEKVVKDRQAAKLEQKVESGDLVKVKTPFGSAYIKNEKKDSAKEAK